MNWPPAASGGRQGRWPGEAAAWLGGTRVQAGDGVPLQAEWDGEYPFALTRQGAAYELTPAETPEAE